MFNGPIPDATAPEDTMITCVPAPWRACTASTMRSIAAGSTRLSGPVRDEEPIFTTTRRAAVIRVRRAVSASNREGGTEVLVMLDSLEPVS